MGLLGLLSGGPTAPDLVGDTWFNRDELPSAAREAVAAGRPVRLGREIEQTTVINFWSYECIECGDLIPTLREWWQELQSQGFIVIGVHTPTYESEGRKENVQSAVLRYGMTYPILSDPGLANWHAWKARVRPQLFLVTDHGRIKKKIGNMDKLAQFESSVCQLVSS